MTKTEEREWVALENQGQKIFGILHRPLVKGPAPAVLICHGFGGNKAGKYRLYVRLAEKLAKAGILAFRFDFRGSGDSEGEFSEMTLQGEISDALIALQFLSKEPQVDVKRVGMFGRSLGGVVAVLAARRFEKIKSLALWSPAFSGQQWQEKWKKAQDPSMTPDQIEQLKRFDGNMANDRFLREFFSLQIEGDLRSLEHIPLLHIHGEKDDQVNITHAQQYSDCRTDAKAATRMIRLPYSDHDFSNLKEQAFAIEETSKWFQETL